MSQNVLTSLISKGLLLILYPLLLSCTILPSSGPSKLDVYKTSYGQMPIIPVTPAVTQLVNIKPLSTWSSLSKVSPIDYETLDVGNKLDILIWENSSEGLYTTDPKGAANLGPMVISGSGNIYLPYVGKIKAAGLNIEQLQQKLTKILKNKAINPQIIVKKMEGRSKEVSIQGIVAKPGTLELLPGRHDFMSILAEAGGTTLPPEVTQVTLERHGQRFTTTLSDIYHSAKLNINLHPKDDLIFSEISQSFTILGASGIQKLIKFPKNELSLTEAIALAQGLNDEAANPAGVFLLRYEKTTILQQLTPSYRNPSNQPYAQVIYELNMRKMQSVFSARQFQVRDGDLIIATDAPYTNVRKVLFSLNPAIGLGRAF